MRTPSAIHRTMAALYATVLIFLPIHAAAEERLYDVQAVNTEIADVLSALSLQASQNILVGSEVKGQITVRLKQVRFEEALEYITRAHGCAYRKDGSTYLVSTIERLRESYSEEQPLPDVTDLYTADYLDAGTLSETLKKLFQGLSVTVCPDVVMPAVGQSDGGGYSSADGSQDSGGASGTSSTRTLILRGPESMVREAQELAKRLDRPRQQVWIEVIVLDVNDEASKDLGIDWKWSSMHLSEELSSGGADDNSDQGSLTSIKFGDLYRSAANFTATISAMIKSGGARLLAKPNLSVLDCEQGSILIGERRLYPKIVSYAENRTPIFDKEEVRVGISLKVTPRVSDDGFITMGIYPEVSTITGWLETDQGSYPQISTREAQTTVRVRSGEQIAIGGLLREEDYETQSRIPVLSDIPILGKLFSNRSTKKVKSEIVIIITPQIFSEPATEGAAQ